MNLGAVVGGLAVVVGGCYPTYVFDLPEGTSSAAGGTCGTFTRKAASSLVDDFSAGTDAPNWMAYGNCVEETGGELVITPPVMDTQFCTYGTAAKYHLTCDSLFVKVVQATSSSQGVQTVIYLINDDPPDELELVLEAQRFSLGQTMSDSAPFEILGYYDPSTDLWWRFRENGGTLFFETSPNGVDWNDRGHGPTPMSLDAIQIQLGAGTDAPIGDPGQARFDCYNKLPCP